MKRLFYLFVCALPLFFVASCDDEKDLPNVDFAIQISGGQFVDGEIYVTTNRASRLSSPRLHTSGTHVSSARV